MRRGEYALGMHVRVCMPVRRLNILGAPKINILEAPKINILEAPKINILEAPKINILGAPKINILGARQISGDRNADERPAKKDFVGWV